MRKKFTILSFLLLANCLLWISSFSQTQPASSFPTDAELQSLVTKYVHTPVVRIQKANGDVFLQRDLSDYLQNQVFHAPEVSADQQDYGHNHNDQLLVEYLNRPHPDVSTMNKYFNAAAQEFNVPVHLLKATAQVQSNWAQVSSSIYGSWGVMGIIENPYVQQISQAAGLLHVDASAIKTDAKTNIRAAAALLSFYKLQSDNTNTEAAWFEALEKLTGLTDAAMRRELALRILDVATTGSKTVSLWGEIIRIDPVEINLPKSITESTSEMITTENITAVDHPNAIANYTTCNYNSRPAGAGINFYFVHYVATGTYQGAISWFKDCSSVVSAHYVIRNSDGQISQVVAEADRAWSQGVTLYNDQGIGVEHEVLATNLSMWDSQPMLDAAASLAADVCNRRGIPKVRRAVNGDPGIYGHSDVKATDCPNLTPERWNTLLNKIANASASVATPVLYSIENPGTGNTVKATWKANTEMNLLGYRLYYATNDALTQWQLAADETTLTASTTSITLNPASFVQVPTGNVYHFKLTAVVTDGANPNVESMASDVYSRSSGVTGSSTLIVDGFDRFTGSASWSQPTHSFATKYFNALRDKGFLQISTAANEKVEDGTINLNNYDIVVWFVGDESSADVTFSSTEKTAVKNFLNGGGKIIISGSEIAYNLSRPAAATYDADFANNYLKSTYVSDGASSYTPATGIAGTVFEGLNIPFGITYPEDFPDAIAAFGGAQQILAYNAASRFAGVAYKGNFGTSTIPGALIFLSFTLETASDISMANFMQPALLYFDETIQTTPPTAVADSVVAITGMAKRIYPLINDLENGTAIDPATIEITTQPEEGTITLEADGAITYVSNNGFAGLDSFSYRVKNILAQTSNTAFVKVNVSLELPCNPDAPEADDNHPKRDVRGAWVSSVSNIDWPSSRTLTTAQQQASLITILDTLQATGINTIFLQVRPEGDALYASTIEPWSYWLTNSQGTPPSPFWDPLEFAIQEAHARGMELHAWINPYRAKQSTPLLATNHVAVQHPEWTFISGTSTLLNPGLPQVRDYVTQVVADIASRYAVDGIHFDDYFYPYAGMTGEDNQTYIDHNPNAIPNIEDWRRENINMLIAKVYDTISFINNAQNRNILFGVSPFGIWKSGTPAGIVGTSSYSQVYCDPIAWMQAGKVDYLAPQLYWKITGAQDYLSLSKWWNDQAALYNRVIYPGLALYKMNDANNWAATEIQNQIDINRAITHLRVKGQIMFSTNQIMSNSKGIKTALKAEQYKYKSVPPALPWKDAVCPNAPLNLQQDGDTLRWDLPLAAADGDIPQKFIVYRFNDASEVLTHRQDPSKIYAIVYGNKIGTLAEDVNYYFAVSSLDKNNNESPLSPALLLPINGFDFTVQLWNNRANLQWKTESETNSSHFEIERSTDGIHFSSIGNVAAAGNSHSTKTYQSTDLLLETGLYYYRIKLVNADQSVNYSVIRSVLYQNDQPFISIWPNPFRDQINLNHLSNATNLELTDMRGRVVLRKNVNLENSLQLNLAHLPAGVYLIRIQKNNGEQEVRKIVKQ